MTVGGRTGAEEDRRRLRLPLFLTIAIADLVFLAQLPLPATFIACNATLVFLCTYYIINGKPRIFGLYHIFYTFHLIFFGILPPLELAFGVVYWGGSESVFNQYTPAMALAAGLMVVFDIVYRSYYREPSRFLSAARGQEMQGAAVPVAVSLASATYIYWYNGFSIGSVIFRGGDLSSRVEMDQIQWLFYQYYLYPMPIVSLVYYWLFCRRSKLLTAILITVAIAANPATGMARFQAASLYIAVGLALFPGLIFRRVLLSSALVFGMFFIFPLLDLFRRFSSTSDMSFSLDYIYQGHFDAFQSLARVLHEGMVTWGYQLLGAVLFFVPRQWWADKPVGSGSLIASQTGLVWTNVSMTFIGEGYINFGLLGSLIFIGVAGFAAGRLDAGYHFRSASISQTHRVFYLFALGLAFFMMRGDLLSSFAYSVALLLAVFTLVTLSNFFAARTAR